MRKSKLIIVLAAMASLCSCSSSYSDDDLDYGDDLDFGKDLDYIYLRPVENLTDSIKIKQVVDSVSDELFLDMLMMDDNSTFGVPSSFIRDGKEVYAMDVLRNFQDSIGKEILPLLRADKQEGIRTEDYLEYFYAGVKQGARIYADREVFGRPAGTNLGEFFDYASYFGRPSYRGMLYATVALAHYPDGKVLAVYRDLDSPLTFNDIFREDAMLERNSFLKLNVPADESMDGATLTVEIPVEGELFLKAVFGLDYDPWSDPSLYERSHTLKGSIKIHL